jgi:hypothetical protein
MKECRTVYLDERGELAAAYYSNLHLGEDVAIKLYQRYMLPHVGKFSKQMSYGDIAKNVNFRKNPTIHSISGIINTHAGTKLSEETIERLALNKMAYENIIQNVTAFDFTDVTEFNTLLNETQYNDARAAIIKEQKRILAEDIQRDQLPTVLTTLEDKKKSVVKDHLAVAHLGEKGHMLLETLISTMQQDYATYGSKFDINKTIASILRKDIFLDNFQGQEGVMKPLLETVGKLILTRTKSFTYKVYMEKSVIDEDLQISNRMDLVIEKDNKHVDILDFKFITASSYPYIFLEDPDRRMGGSLHNWYDNKYTKMSLQLGLERYILNKQNITVDNLEVIPIKVVMQEEKVGETYSKVFNRAELQPLIRIPYDSKLVQAALADIGIIDNAIGVQLDVNNIAEQLSGTDEVIQVDIDKRVTRLRNSLRRNNNNDYIYINTLTNKTKVIDKTKTEAEITAILRAYLEEVDAVNKNRGASFVTYYTSNNFNIWPTKVTNKQGHLQQAKNVLYGFMQPEQEQDYIIEHVNNYSGLESLSKDFVLVRHKITNEATLIALNGNKNRVIAYEGLTGKRTTVFGNLATDKQLLKYREGGTLLRNTEGGYRTLTAAMVLLKLKEIYPSLNIMEVRTANLNGNVGINDIDRYPTAELLEQMSILKNLLLTSTDPAYTELKKLLNNQYIMNVNNYNTDYLEAYLQTNLIAKGKLDLLIGTKKYTSYRTAIEDYKTGSLLHDEFVTATFAYFKRLEANIRKNSTGNVTAEDLGKNKEYMLMKSIIQQLLDFEMHYTKRKRLRLDKSVAHFSKINSPVVKDILIQYDRDNTNIREEFTAYYMRIKEYTKQLLEQRGYNRSLTNSKGEIYKHIYNKPENNDITTMTFVEEGTKAWNDLVPAERDLIKVFKEMLYRSIELSQGKEKAEEVKAGKTAITLNHIPVLPNMTDVNLLENLTSNTPFGRGIESTVDNYLYKYFNDDAEYTIGDKQLRLIYILDNIRNRALENHLNINKRLESLGINGMGDTVEDNPLDFETNIEKVVGLIFRKSLEEHYLTRTATIAQLTDVHLAVEESTGLSDNNELRGYLQEMLQILSLNIYTGESTLEKSILAVNKTATISTLALSPKNIALEGITNVFATTSMLATDLLASKIFKANRRFNLGSFTKALKLVLEESTNSATARKLNAIIKTYGILEGDSYRLTEEANLVSTATNIFQSKNLMWLNNLPYEKIKTAAFIAKMLYDGSYDAHSVGADGKLKYDVKKDKRYYTATGEFKSADAEALYTAMVEELRFDTQALDANNVPTRAYIQKEITDFKDYTLRWFGSLDKNSRITAINTVWGKLALTFRSWLVSKKDAYYTPREIDSGVRGYWKKGEDGQYTWVGDPIEGILQTVLYMLKLPASEKLKLHEHLTPIQKENLSKLLADILLVLLLFGGFGLIKDAEFFKTPHGKLAAYTFTNAIGDLHIIKAMNDSVVEGGIFPGVSIFFDKVVTVFNSIGGEGVDINKLVSTTGLGRSIVGY